MNYFINDHIIYNSRKGLLYSDDINNAIKLTTTLNRLLLVLIQNNGEILDRETVLRRVWEDHNQVVSDNNLNSSISVLRRHLSSFSDNEIITTIPKVGIKFSAIIKTENPDMSEISNENDLSPENQNEHLAITEIEQLEAKSDDLETQIENKEEIPEKKSYMLNNRYLEIGLIVIIIFCLLYLFKSYFFSSKTEYPEVGQIDQCTIRYINSYHKPDTRIISFSILKEKLARVNIDCTKPATVFYYNVAIVTNDKDKNNDYLFLSHCPSVSEDNTTVSCENFYVK